MKRTILHCDLNSFFASVEELYHPEARGKPIAVAGSRDNRHGIILAKNQLAKKKNVITAETVWQAMNKCPDLVLFEPNYQRYELFSKKVREIFYEYTDKVEPFGIDEAWLDVTESAIFGDGVQIADTIRNRIKNELGITASVGVSFNKIFAKLGSDLRKPDYTTVISEENFRDVVWPLNVEEMLYIGKSSQMRLNAMGIYTIGQLANEKIEDIEKYFGKNGVALWYFANGLDDSVVSADNYFHQNKSISNNITAPKDLKTYQDADLILLIEAEKLAEELRRENMYCHEVSVVFRDIHLKSTVHQIQLDLSSNLADEIYEAARTICRKYWNCRIPLRSIGIRVAKLGNESNDQSDIFTDSSYRQKQLQLEQTIDIIRSRFGSQSVKKLAVLSDRVLTGCREIENEVN